MYRKPGDFLNPGRMNSKQLEALKKSVFPHVFESQYQQRPTLGGSGMCSIDRLVHYKAAPPFEFKIHSWDIGATTTGNASVCTKWGVARNAAGHDIFYLIDVVTIKVQLPDVEAAIKMHDKLDKPAAIVIDHRGVGLGIYQRLRGQEWKHVYDPGKKGESNEGKIDRFAMSLLLMYDGLVQFPETGAFVEQLHYALATFPDSKELDLVDSITQLISHYKTALIYARYDRRPTWL
jgi:phage terminase large subunit-like protein